MANTGYRINTYIDVNPKSPTFNTTREERVRDDSSCGVASASWEVVSSYCELDDLGANTGFYITSEMDTNVSSPTYGTTRENRSQNLSECPLPSKDPQWAFDMEDAECEEKLFPKSGLYGQTGRLHAIVTDENIYSDTFGQTEERYLTISDWTSDMKSAYGDFPCEAVDTNPQIEAISEACETVADEYGTLVFNGFKNVTGLDKNPYSDTYLDSVTQRVQDTVKCPPAEDAKFYYRDGSQDNLTTRNITVGWEKSNYTIYVTSSRGSGVLPYSVSIPSSSWMSYDKPNDTTLTFTIEKNMNTTERSQTVTLTQDRTSKECTIRFTQETPPYYFYIGSNSSTTSQTISVSNSSTSETLTITSLFGDEYKDYDVSGVPNWVTTRKMSANKTITFTIDANTSTTSRSATVTLTQQTSGKRCVITLSQGGATPTTYTFGISKTSGGSTASTLSYSMSSAIGTQTVYVTSSSSVNSSLGWSATITKGSSWIKVPTEQQGLLVFTIDGNTDTDDREGTITLTQNESGKQCAISITQEGTPEECKFLFNNGNKYDLENYDYLNGASLPISANCDWDITVSGDDTDVISITPSSGKGGETTNLTVKAPLNVKYGYKYNVKLSSSCSCASNKDSFDINFEPYQIMIDGKPNNAEKIRFYIDDGSTYEIAYPVHMYDQWYKRWLPWSDSYIGKYWYAISYLSSGNVILKGNRYGYSLNNNMNYISRRGFEIITTHNYSNVYFIESNEPMIKKSIECNGGILNLDINNPQNLSMSVDSSVSWIVPSMVGTTLRLTIESYNNDSNDRNGVVTLTTSDGYSLKAFITQNMCSNENTPEYVQTYGEKFSYGATGNYEFSQLWVMCETYSIEEGFYNAGSETQNSGDVYVLEKFVDKHDYIEFRVYARDSGISGLYFYFGDFNFSYSSDNDFNVRTGLAGQVNGKQINVRVTRINEIPMALAMDAEVEETE